MNQEELQRELEKNLEKLHNLRVSRGLSFSIIIALVLVMGLIAYLAGKASENMVRNYGKYVADSVHTHVLDSIKQANHDTYLEAHRKESMRKMSEPTN